MRAGIIAVALASVAGAAGATPSFEIRDAAARVTVIPAARSDIKVVQISTNGRLPLHLERDGERVRVVGNLHGHDLNCQNAFGGRWVSGWGLPRIRYEDLPQVVVYVPLQAQVAVSGAVWGVVGHGQSLDFSSAGCGDWRVADMDGPLTIRTSGSGDVAASRAGRVDVRASGSSDITVREARGGLTAAVSGSGDVHAGAVEGALTARITGSGDVTVDGGRVSDMHAAIAGSGDVHFGGVAGALSAEIAGSGDISAAKVTGPVIRHISGSGDVTVGGR